MVKHDCAIFDLDGTLVNVDGIRHFAEAGDFHAFHEAAIDCPPIKHVAEAARDYSRNWGLDIVVVTAREAIWRNPSAFWLAMHDVPSDGLAMRGKGDYRPDDEVKRDILPWIRAYWNPVIAWDDNPEILAVWKAGGIDTVRVGNWERKR